MSDGKLLNLKHARTQAQTDKMRKLIKLGICPFCEENLEKYHDAPIETRGKWWNVTKNDYPYEGASLQYLFIYRSHTRDIADLPAEAFSELGELARTVSGAHSLPGATLFLRYGDMEWTGGSVGHLHAQLIAGGPRDERSEKLKVGIGYKKK